MDDRQKKLNEALVYASFLGEQEIVELLLEFGADVNYWSERGYKTALHAAISENNLGTAEILLKAGAKIDINVFTSACINKKIEAVELLLANGAEVNGDKSEVVLRAAALSGSAKIVELLLDAGVDDNSKNLALQAAIKEKHSDIIILLLKNGASLEKSV